METYPYCTNDCTWGIEVMNQLVLELISSRKKSSPQTGSGSCPAHCHLRNANSLGAVTSCKMGWELTKQWNQPIQFSLHHTKLKLICQWRILEEEDWS